MIRFILIFITVSISFNGKAQNDTIYLKKNHLVLDGKTYNSFDSFGKKTGKWITFIIDDSVVESTLGCGDNFFSDDLSVVQYRTLKEGEYSGIKILISEKVDTIDNSVYVDSKHLETRNKLPSDLYFITSVGRYERNRKEGLWNYFYQSGNVEKTINYLNGLPENNFKVFRDDGTLMFDVIKTDESLWEVRKYESDGTLKETLSGNIEKFAMIY